MEAVEAVGAVAAVEAVEAVVAVGAVKAAEAMAAVVEAGGKWLARTGAERIHLPRGASAGGRGFRSLTMLTPMRTAGIATVTSAARNAFPIAG